MMMMMELSHNHSKQEIELDEHHFLSFLFLVSSSEERSAAGVIVDVALLSLVVRSIRHRNDSLRRKINSHG